MDFAAFNEPRRKIKEECCKAYLLVGSWTLGRDNAVIKEDVNNSFSVETSEVFLTLQKTLELSCYVRYLTGSRAPVQSAQSRLR